MNDTGSDAGSSADLPQGPRPGARDTTFFEDPVKDHLLRAVVTLSMELSVTRDRLASMQALLEESGAVPPGRLDNYAPPMEAAQLREQDRQKLITDVLGPLVSRLSRPD